MLVFWLGVCVFKFSVDLVTVYCIHDPPVSFIFTNGDEKVSTLRKGEGNDMVHILWSGSHCPGG